MVPLVFLALTQGRLEVIDDIPSDGFRLLDLHGRAINQPPIDSHVAALLLRGAAHHVLKDPVLELEGLQPVKFGFGLGQAEDVSLRDADAEPAKAFHHQLARTRGDVNADPLAIHTLRDRDSGPTSAHRVRAPVRPRLTRP